MTWQGNLADSMPRRWHEVDWERLSFADVIAHGHTVSAFAAQDQALQQRGSLTCRATPPVVSVALSIGPQYFLIRLVLLPADVAGERVGQKDFPVLLRNTPISMRATDRNLRRARAPEDEGSGVSRIVENSEHADYVPAAKRLSPLLVHPKQFAAATQFL